MSGFVLHPAAFADLEEIWEFIAADSLDAADRVLEEIFQAIHSLVPFPLVGICFPEPAQRSVRVARPSLCPT